MQNVVGKPLKSNNNISQKRASNFELLRILSILLIIFYHFFLHGDNGKLMLKSLSLNKVIAISLGSWGLLGVNCFVFISAYFLIGSKRFRIDKIIRIVLETIFYSVVIAMILSTSHMNQLSWKDYIKSIIAPFDNAVYWFITSYCLLYIIHPFLNRLIYSLTSMNLFVLTIILTIGIPIYSTVFPGHSFTGDFGFFVYLYLLMGFLKRNDRNWFHKHAIGGFVSTSVGIVLFEIIATIIHVSSMQRIIEGFSPFMVLDAIFLFYVFMDIDLGHNKLINTCASTILGIYIIHENPFLGKILWDKILKANYWFNSNIFVLAYIGDVLFLFILAMIVDLIRINLIERPLFSLEIKSVDRFLSKIDALMINVKCG